MKNIVYISVDKLHPHPDNPRRDLGDLTELAESIKSNGVLQNLTVVPYVSPVHNRTMEGLYTVIIGHRRLAAAKLAGLTELPCVITDMTPQKQFQTMMIENVNRSDLTTYEQAEGFQMMLDMGDTVETVAKQTGFSETTIRRRVKLLDLDKKKFQKAEERGGTMTEYLKLNEIKDPKLRNEVLNAVGTANFNTDLKSAIDQEENEAYMAEVKAALEAADWCQQVDSNAVSGNKAPYSYVTCFNKWNKNEVKRPDDADTVKYVYYISNPQNTQIFLYREKKAEETVDPMVEKHKLLNAELSQITKELDSISENHREVREEFILNFGAFNSSEMDIASFAVKAMMWVSENRGSVDPDRLGNLLGVPVSEDEELDPKAWAHELFNRPQRVLLCTTYALLEGAGRKYSGSTYDYNVSVSRPKHNESLALDLIYSGLKSLGYEMSDEEKQMKDGSHPLYKRAQFLIDDYLREKEAAAQND